MSKFQVVHELPKECSGKRTGRWKELRALLLATKNGNWVRVDVSEDELLRGRARQGLSNYFAGTLRTDRGWSGGLKLQVRTHPTESAVYLRLERKGAAVTGH